ncbi:hypothetical protein C0993_004667 [Termitomyces sp. T159_Od127]|nr:hypothetical protein C0993_004667 [Termitomyces sp. T159_Od127]
MTPRITDETWPFLWAHVFEPSTPKLPIFGKIEFDLDFHRAPWFETWLTSSRRENNSSTVFPSAATDIHERGDFKSTRRDDQDITVLTTAHIPRKLSLVDRYGMHSACLGFPRASRTEPSLPEQPRSLGSQMTPIFRDEEYKTTRKDLDRDGRIETWRSDAILKSTTLDATGKISLETANMSRSLSIDDTILDNPNDQPNLEDFTWSITSAGPDDNNIITPVSSDRIPSVHIANRVEGSVCLTPSDCTSFGPSDYALSSPASSTYRLPSPDIAYRMFENAPHTPSTATTWGVPTETPRSSVFSRPPSVDLGERMIFSRPVTPTIATS